MKRTILLSTITTLITSINVAQNTYVTAIETNAISYPAATYELKDEALSELLGTAPRLHSDAARMGGTVIELPDPTGKLIELEVFESPIIAPELAAKYPGIQTYKVQGDGISGRIGYTYKGFHGILFSKKGTFYIDPIKGEKDQYHSYERADFMAHHEDKKEHICLVDGYHISTSGAAYSEATRSRQTGDQLRTYRLALACTGEYAQFHGGNTASVLSAMVVTMNRVNGVYERDFCVTMEIIDDNDQLIFFNGATDPYTNNSGFAMLGENQNTIDNIIGPANYDIGHVFSTGGGGIASLGSVCSFTRKAQGVTGGGSPVGDPFDIDYVAHEIGHQFAGNHTQNNNCNRNPLTAWEPGSASTIMGYAGICAPNLQNNSDDYFHSGNYSEMRAFFQNGNGNTCAVITNTGNTPPVVKVDPINYTIPIETPFVLRGSATDINDDNLSYCWEQMDIGPSGDPTAPVNNAPIFRSWDPVDHGERTFPRLESVLNGNLVVGELYPTYTREMEFRLTVRDNNIAGGGLSFDEVNINVDQDKGPFVVNTPAQFDEVQAGVYYTVNWDVAGTDQSPVNCSAVHILVYSNFGFDLEDTLAANVPNTGSCNVKMPTDLGFGYRIRVEAADNVFFNYNPGNFFIIATEALSGNINLNLTPDWVNGGLMLDWNDPFDNENEWIIERSIGGNASFTVIDTLTVNTTQYLDQEVNMFGTEYHYRIYATNPVGNSAYSNEVSWLGVGMKALSQSQMKVFPNPANTHLSVALKRADIAQLLLRDAEGKVILKQSAGSAELSVELLPAGNYFLEVLTTEHEVLVSPVNITH